MLVVLQMVKYAQDYKCKQAKSCRRLVMKVDSGTVLDRNLLQRSIEHL